MMMIAPGYYTNDGLDVLKPVPCHIISSQRDLFWTLSKINGCLF